MFLYFNLLLYAICVIAQEIRIGAIFDQNDNDTEQIFNSAIDVVNNEENINFKLAPVIITIPYGNELYLSKKLCKVFKRGGVSVVFGPYSTLSARHAINICDNKEIPYIDTRWDVHTKPPVINMHPHPHVIADLVTDLVKAWEWQGFTILYESASWLPRMSTLLKLYDSKGYTITLRKIDLGLDSKNSFRSILRQVRLSSDNHIVLDCSLELLPEVLTQIQQVGLMTSEYQYIITTLDIDTIDLDPFKYSDANITGIRIINPENPILEQLRKQLYPEPELPIEEESEDDGGPPPELKVTLQNALLYDGVLLLSEAFKQLDYELIQQKRIDCNSDDSWENGESITNFMRNTVVNGLTGEVKFDNHGIRTSIFADIIDIGWVGVTKVGTWNSSNDVSNRLVITRKFTQNNEIDDGTLRNKTFKVVISLTEPYGMLKDSSTTLTGNNRFEGFGIDLIHSLSQMLGFNYEFILQEDNLYGEIRNGTWNGMIGKLINWEADLAITDLTITAERESGVDFTMPFMNLGISLLFSKPTKEPPSTFSFMSPFSTEVWIYLGAAYVGVSLCLFILGRLSPSEWDNPYPCVEEPTHLENQFSFRNSMWFTIGALLQQGSEIAPKAPSTRAVASIWWFFTLIMVSSYTANLAAFLTVESVSSPIKSAEDLKVCGDPSKTCPVKFGAKKSGSTYKFFEEAEQGTYQQMFNYMSAHPEHLTDDNNDGRELAKNGDYAFLMESSSIEYITQRHCDLRQVGGLLDDKGYGIAMRKNSSYRSALSEGVLKLQEQGELTKLKTKWWKEKKGGGSCSDESDDGGSALALEFANVEGVFLLLMAGVVVAMLCNLLEFIIEIRKNSQDNKKKDNGEAEELGMQNMFGIFIVLVIGSALASCYGCIEWLIILYKKSRIYKVPFREELMAELKFLIQCKGNTKTVRHRKNSSEESHHSSNTYRSNHSRHSDI